MSELTHNVSMARDLTCKPFDRPGYLINLACMLVNAWKNESLGSADT